MISFDLETWQILSIAGNFVLGILSIALAIMTVHFKNKSVLRDQRFEMYKEAINEIDQVNTKMQKVFSVYFLNDLQSFLADMLNDSSDLTKHILTMNNRMHARIAEASEIINTLYVKLDKIRLVASINTLKLLDIYRELSTQGIAAQAEFTESIQLPKTSDDLKRPDYTFFDQEKMTKLNDIQQQLAKVRVNIEKQMRTDIGYRNK